MIELIEQFRARHVLDQLPRAWRKVPRLRRMLVLLLFCEMLAMIVLPAVVPNHVYFSRYLSDPRAKESVLGFFDGAGYLQPDPATGWRNRPNVVRGKWITDQYGSRSQELLSVERSGDRMRVLFVGSSKINGGTNQDSAETISSGVTSQSVETLNFGTMLFAVDQCYWAYVTDYSRFKPDVVVLGLDSRPEEALVNMYLPLRNREEVLMPFVKPRFELDEGALRKIEAPLELLRHSMDQPEALLEFLSRHDDFYRVFEEFQRFGFTPIADGANRAAHKLRTARRTYLADEPTDAERLLIKLLIRFRNELAEENRQLVLLMLPDRDSVDASDAWQEALVRHRRLHDRLATNGLDFVDPREALRSHSGDKMFGADRVHYTPAGNGVIAGELGPLLGKIHARRVGGTEQGVHSQGPTRISSNR